MTTTTPLSAPSGKRIVASLVAAIAATAGLASAQNLVVNGRFDTDVTTGWTLNTGDRQWTPIDRYDASGSGSALLTSSPASISDEVLFQCVPVAPDETYAVEVDVYVPSGQGAGARAGVVTYAYPTTSCFGAPVASGSDSSAVVDEWNRVGTSLAAPGSAQSVQVRLTVVKLPGVDVSAYFDEVLVGPKIFRDGFESGDVAAWTSAVPR